MCEECRQIPCHPRCPNAPDPPMVYKCIYCAKPIREGDEFYDVDGDPWCEDCMTDCHKTAEVDDEGD